MYYFDSFSEYVVCLDFTEETYNTILADFEMYKYDDDGNIHEEWWHEFYDNAIAEYVEYLEYECDNYGLFRVADELGVEDIAFDDSWSSKVHSVDSYTHSDATHIADYINSTSDLHGFKADIVKA